MEYIDISYEFAEKYLRYANPLHTQVFLYIKYIFSRDGYVPTIDSISADLDIAANRVKFILGYWVSEGELIQIDDGTYAFPQDTYNSEEHSNTKKRAEKPKRKARRSTSARPSYKSAEIENASEKNQVLSGMFFQAESILGHLLSGGEMELLYSFYDWLGLPCEVIVMLLNYAAKRGKTGKRYLETVAIDWADKGIDTYEKAEDYIKQLEEQESIEHQIRSILGIYDRALTQTEKKYIKAWTELSLNTELISLAYDRTVNNTGKLSYSYMNKILVSWHDEGITDSSGVKRSEEIFSLKNGYDKSKQKNKSGDNTPNVQKSKFNNYTDTNKIDYASLEEKILDMMLDN